MKLATLNIYSLLILVVREMEVSSGELGVVEVFEVAASHLLSQEVIRGVLEESLDQRPTTTPPILIISSYPPPAFEGFFASGKIRFSSDLYSQFSFLRPWRILSGFSAGLVWIHPSQAVKEPKSPPP